MEFVLFFAVVLVSFANGANDNFKGVATLWGADRTSYRPALAWATAFTLLGSFVAIWFAAGLVSKFNGSKFVSAAVYTQRPFLVAIAFGAGTAVLLASRLGLPISTTHALTGALVGAGVAAAGLGQVKFAALGSGVVLPLLLSPVIALVLTLLVYPVVVRVGSAWQKAECVCLENSPAIALAAGSAECALADAAPATELRVGPASECGTGAPLLRFLPGDALHWLSGAAISFARGLNDTPKIAAVLLVAATNEVNFSYTLVAVAMALGGVLGTARVAHTMSKQLTPMSTQEAVSANLVAASLVTLASRFGLPVSTTHVTTGAILGIGFHRRAEANWSRVREILLSWIATLPLSAAVAAGVYLLFS